MPIGRDSPETAAALEPQQSGQERHALGVKRRLDREPAGGRKDLSSWFKPKEPEKKKQRTEAIELLDDDDDISQPAAGGRAAGAAGATTAGAIKKRGEWKMAADDKSAPLGKNYKEHKRNRMREGFRQVADAARKQGVCTGARRSTHSHISYHAPECRGQFALTPDNIFRGAIVEYAHWPETPRAGDHNKLLSVLVQGGPSKKKLTEFLKTGRWLHAACHAIETQSPA